MANDLSARSIRRRLSMVVDGNPVSGKAVGVEVLALQGGEDGTEKIGGPGSDFSDFITLEPQNGAHPSRCPFALNTLPCCHITPLFHLLSNVVNDAHEFEYQP